MSFINIYQAWLNLLPLFLPSSKLQWNSFLGFNSWPGFPGLLLCYHCLLLLVSFCPIKYLFLYFLRETGPVLSGLCRVLEPNSVPLPKKADLLACGMCHLASLVLFYRFPHIFLEWPVATSDAWADPLWKAERITCDFPEKTYLCLTACECSHGLFQSVSNKVYVRAFTFISKSDVAYMTWSGWDGNMSISSLSSLAAVVPSPQHVTVRPISWWFHHQLPLHPSPHNTTGGSHVHAHALKCYSALHCSGLQNNSVFLSNSLFFLVLVTPPGLVSSSGLHSHTFFLVGHPGGNKVKAVLKASCSARSPSLLLCAPLSSHASYVPINLVISPTQTWEKLDAWTLSEAEPGAGSKMWEGPSVSSGCAGRPGLLHGEHHKGKAILHWKNGQVPLSRSMGDGNLCIP